MCASTRPPVSGALACFQFESEWESDSENGPVERKQRPLTVIKSEPVADRATAADTAKGYTRLLPYRLFSDISPRSTRREAIPEKVKETRIQSLPRTRATEPGNHRGSKSRRVHVPFVRAGRSKESVGTVVRETGCVLRFISARFRGASNRDRPLQPRFGVSCTVPFPRLFDVSVSASDRNPWRWQTLARRGSCGPSPSGPRTEHACRKTFVVDVLTERTCVVDRKDKPVTIRVSRANEATLGNNRRFTTTTTPLSGPVRVEPEQLSACWLEYLRRSKNILGTRVFGQHCPLERIGGTLRLR